MDSAYLIFGQLHSRLASTAFNELGVAKHDSLLSTLLVTQVVQGHHVACHGHDGRCLILGVPCLLECELWLLRQDGYGPRVESTSLEWGLDVTHTSDRGTSRLYEQQADSCQIDETRWW
jgi:hypothetical protein